MPEEGRTSARRPASVVFVAKTHALVGFTALLSFAVLHLLTRRLPQIEFGPKTYVIAASIGVFYVMTAALVWLGSPAARFFSRLCGLVYLSRPAFGSKVWRAMDAAEFKAYFTRRDSAAKPPDVTPHSG